ncbi:hypothetical protein D778_00615 [Xanthomarina gelatinilytica]|jgi:hypothetical protein|uniref:Uncharacterized protein n=2 Tax=Xanthomarina gelatinilytica TaxID=1137281 RepID=M7MHU5_9FLAO|nr:hypothetical protein D778_00615 [Xanthomarina gelatinilytica]
MMSKTLLKFSIIALCFTLFNCKNESASFTNYKYADKENILVCDNLDTKLYFEALLSFEDDITNKYNPQNKDLRRSYSFFTRDAIANRVNYQDIVSPHTMEVFEALKQDKDLWNADNSINYNADIFKCVSSNFKNKDLQTTFNALVSTNSMRPDLFGAPLIKHVKNAHDDRYMAAYIALDLFYARLFQVDPTTVTEKPETDKANTNKAVKGTPQNVILNSEKKG